MISRMSARRGIGEDAAVAERAGAPLHPALEPADDLALGEALGGPAAERLVVAELGDAQPCRAELGATRVERPPHGRVAERRPPVAVVHDEAPGPPEQLMLDT